MNLLMRARRINNMLQNSNGKTEDYNKLAETLKEVINANIFIVDSNGDLPGFAILQEIDNDRMNKMLAERHIPEKYTKGLLNISETTPNLDVESEYTAFPVENKELFMNGLTTIVPIVGGGERLGTLILSRLTQSFWDEDFILAEYGATVVGMEVLRERSEIYAGEVRSKTMVQMAIKSLSFSEMEAIEYIVEELNGTEGVLVASKIADRASITRSVIVNAIRKLESAGVIESRSLGMKGTYLKVLNKNFLEKIKEQDNRKLF